MKTKRNYYLLPIIGLLAIFLINCKKKEKDTAPTPTPITKTVYPPELYYNVEILDTNETSVICQSKIVSNNGGEITAKGVCCSRLPDPTISNWHTNDGSGSGTFTSSITGLKGNTEYYVRSYATNSGGTAYSLNSTFTTEHTGVLVGDSYQGGIVFYIFQSGDLGYVAGQTHGLISATYDQSASIPWTNGGYPTIPTSLEIGTGNANTNAIVSIQGNGNYAAKLCADLVRNGYSDWYLPSKKELNELFINRELVGSFSWEFYWSSSQYDINGSWCQDFGSGLQNTSGSYTFRVRAIRSF